MTDRAREILARHKLGAAAGGPLLAAMVEALSTPAMSDARLVEHLGDVLDIIAAAENEFARTQQHRDYYDARFKAVQDAIALLDTSRAVDEPLTVGEVVEKHGLVIGDCEARRQADNGAEWLRNICAQGIGHEFSNGAQERLERIAARLEAMDEPENLRQKLRMIISHASGGALSEPDDINRSINDICVEISRHKNDIWDQARKSASRAVDEPTEAMRDALKRRDAEAAKCPVQKGYKDVCPRCKATSSETCGLITGADYAFVEDARSLLRAAQGERL